MNVYTSTCYTTYAVYLKNCKKGKKRKKTIQNKTKMFSQFIPPILFDGFDFLL